MFHLDTILLFTACPKLSYDVAVWSLTASTSEVAAFQWRENHLLYKIYNDIFLEPLLLKDKNLY